MSYRTGTVSVEVVPRGDGFTARCVELGIAEHALTEENALRLLALRLPKDVHVCLAESSPARLSVARKARALT